MSNGIKGLFVFFINIRAGWSLSLNASPSKRPKATTRPPSTLDSQPNTGIKSQVISIPPEGQIDHAVYPGHKGGTGEEDDVTPEDLFSYEQLVGKSTAWVYFSHNWYRSRNFPIETASWMVWVYMVHKSLKLKNGHYFVIWWRKSIPGLSRSVPANPLSCWNSTLPQVIQGVISEWAESALTDLTAFHWSRIIGFSWWNEAW